MEGKVPQNRRWRPGVARQGMALAGFAPMEECLGIVQRPFQQIHHGMPFLALQAVCPVARHPLLAICRKYMTLWHVSDVCCIELGKMGCSYSIHRRLLLPTIMPFSANADRKLSLTYESRCLLRYGRKASTRVWRELCRLLLIAVGWSHGRGTVHANVIAIVSSNHPGIVISAVWSSMFRWLM